MNRTRIQNEMMFMLQDEIYSDSIIPFLKKELKRKVNLHGKVLIRGGIYCHNLEIEAGDIFIQKSVFSQEGITITGRNGGLLWFNSPVSAGHSILVDEGSNVRTRFAKSLRAGSVNLFNTIVYGNVIADQVYLKDSVVLGGVFCKGKVVLENSIIGTYRCRELKQIQNMGLLYPMALSDMNPEMNKNAFMVIPGDYGNESATNLYRLSNDDFYVFFDKNRKKCLYSNTLRIFDMNLYSSRMMENLTMLFDSFTRDMDNIEDSKESFASFDKRYFVFIENGFKPAGKALCSDYFNVSKEVIDKYFENVSKIDSETKSENEYDNTSKADSSDEQSSSWSGFSSNSQGSEDEEIVYTHKSIDPDKIFYCEDCGRNYGKDFNFCEDCGTPLKKLSDFQDEETVKNAGTTDTGYSKANKSRVRCPACKTELGEADFAFCPECGSKLLFVEGVD